MKKLFLAPELLLSGWMGAQTTFAAQWQDVNAFTNSSGYQYAGQQVITDPATGNVFTVGNFENSITIGSFTLTATGSRDIYVAKYNSSGSVIKAVKLGTSGFDEAYSLCYRNNHVFVGAYVNDDGKIYKLDDDATPLDVIVTRSLGWGVRPRSLFTYGSTGNILVGGSFISECWLPKSSGSIYLQSSNMYSPDCSGDCFDSFTGIIDINAYFTHGDNPDNSTKSNEIMGIWCRNGRIYCTGYFKGNMKWSTASSTVTAAGVQDAFIASVYISTWINTMSYNNDFKRAGSNESSPGGSAANDPFWKECGYGIAVNATAIYVTGNLNSASSPVFAGGTYTGAGAFLASLAVTGSNVGSLNWVRTCLDESSGLPTMRSIGYGVAVDAIGNVWSTGRGEGNVKFEGGSNPALTTMFANGCPGYISKYDAAGNILGLDIVNQNWNASSITEGRSITTNGCEVFTTGFSQEYDFQAGNLPSESVGSGKLSMYIFEIGRDITISNDLTYCESCASFPNVLSLSATGGTSYSWSPGTYLSSTTSATPTYSLTACANSGTTNYVCTVTNTVTGCTSTASVSVTAGSSATGVANAGADFDVCPGDVVTMGTNMPDGLTYNWFPQFYLGTTWNQDQPTFTTPTGGLPSAISYTLTVTDVCGNQSFDYITVTPDITCPHRMLNPERATATVFPNPSNGIFTVNLDFSSDEEHVEFMVTDLAGRTISNSIFVSTGGQYSLDLSDQAKGVYMFTVVRNGNSEVFQLIIE